ncbi:hypothetical protein [Reichenbachiella sp. MALMAid0571]|uniref:hypothetical protein n=1 Tax=Reichenbachiella sp. MALMAid0571 TaxID=3143939 RepID=UPI0032DF7F00
MKSTMKRWAWMTMLLIGTISTSITSCNDGEGDTNPGGEEVETAYVRGLESYTPNGTIKYLEVTKDLATNPDLSQAVELGQNVSIHSAGKYPITLSSDSKTITKWKVDKTTLEVSVDGILSYASTGATSTNVAFVSETAAFICDLIEGVFVEFNPTTMELTKTHNVTPLNIPNNFSAYTVGKLYNGKIIFPIQWGAQTCCDYPTPVYATVGVFDPSTGALTYDTDDRAIGLTAPIFIDGDNAYVVPANSQNAWINHYLGASPNPHIALKLNADGTFDDSFISDIEDGLPDASLIRSSSFVFQDKYVFLYSEEELTGSFDNRFSARSSMEYKSVAYDLNTHEAELFSFDNKYNQVYLLATIDGVNYFNTFYLVGGEYSSNILVQNSLEDYSLISTIEIGGFGYLGKLW